MGPIFQPTGILYGTYTHMLSGVYLRVKHGGFQAGQIKTKLNNWKRMTSDPEVLETVKGLKIKFAGNPMTCSQKEQRYFSENENRAVGEEI